MINEPRGPTHININLYIYDGNMEIRSHRNQSPNTDLYQVPLIRTAVPNRAIRLT
jgi:hypothetical protein